MLVILSEPKSKQSGASSLETGGKKISSGGQQIDSTPAVLLQEVANGNKRAFQQLYGIYSQPIASFLSKRTNLSEQIEEILQEIFLTIWKKASYYNSAKGNPEQWIFTIARNKLYDYWRKVDRLGETIQSDWDHFADWENFIPGELSVSLESAMNTLTEDYRQIIKMVYFEGYTQKECSEKMGQPLGTVKWKIPKALGQLKKELEKKSLRYEYETSG